MSTNETDLKVEKKPSRLKGLLPVFGGLLAGAIASVLLMKAVAPKIVDEEKAAKFYIEKQEQNHKLFGKNDANISKMLFEKFPEANSVLVGNLYIVNGTFKLFVRPTGISPKYIEDFDYYSINQNETGLAIYVVTGALKDGIASNVKIKPWHPELEQKEQEWSWSLESIGAAVFKGVFYVFPGFDDLNKASKDFSNGLVEFSIEGIPYSIYKRNEQDTNDSAMFAVTTMNDVMLTGAEDDYGSPIALISDDKIGCVFTAWPERLKNGIYRLEVKDVSCKKRGDSAKYKGIYVVGEDGKYGVKAGKENGYLVIKKGREFTLAAHHAASIANQPRSKTK